MKKRWAWWEILLWAYSTVYVFFMVVVFLCYSIVPLKTTGQAPTSGTNLLLFILSVPPFVFMIIEGVRHLSDEARNS